MSSVTIAADLAKNVFELAVSPRPGQITERHRLTRAKFERFWMDRPPARVVMEACAMAHHELHGNGGIDQPVWMLH